MTFGKPNTLGARVHTAEEAGKIIDVFQAHGHNEIDTARLYGNGTTEEMLAELDWQKRSIIMDTKLYPNAAVSGLALMAGATQYTHRPADVRRDFEDSVKALGSTKVDMFYLHGPDRINSFEESLMTVNELHKEGRFERFGISNYQSWEVAKICEICEKHGWIKPTV